MLAPGEGLLVVCCSFGGVGGLRASCSLKFILGNSGGFGVLLDAAQNLIYGKKSGGFWAPAGCSPKFNAGDSSGFGLPLAETWNLTRGNSGGFGLLLDVAQNLTWVVRGGFRLLLKFNLGNSGGFTLSGWM